MDANRFVKREVSRHDADAPASLLTPDYGSTPMTAQENQAIQMLSAHLMDFIEENRLQHTEIKESIKAIGTHVDGIELHCREREEEVNTILARRQVMFDQEIEAAKRDAVAEAKRPSVYAMATKGAIEGIGHFAARATIVIGLVAGFLALLDRLFHFWGG